MEAIRQKMENPLGGIVVVAHRGCHNAALTHDLPSAPENSLAALENCVRLGVDVIESDIRRSKDGVLVVMHDACVEESARTRGHGIRDGRARGPH